MLSDLDSANKRPALKSDILSLLKSLLLLELRKCRLAEGWEQLSSGIDIVRK